MFRPLQKSFIVGNFSLVAVFLALLSIFSQPLYAGKQSKAEISEYIKQSQNEDDWRKRSQAVQSLGDIAKETDWRRDEIISSLIQSLEDPDAVVQLRSTTELAEITNLDDNSKTIEILIETLKTAEGSTRENLVFILTEAGHPILESLAEHWSKSPKDLSVKSNLTAVIAAIANNLRRGSKAFTETELLDSLISIEKSIAYLPTPEELIKNEVDKVDNILREEDIGIVYIAFQVLQSEATNRRNAFILEIIGSTLGIIIISTLLIAWYRPQFLLSLSRSLVNLRESQTKKEKQVSQLQSFFKQVGANVRRYKVDSIQIISIKGRLQAYLPFPVIGIEEPTEVDVLDLLKQAQQMSQTSQAKGHVGILFYRQSPDAVFRAEMAKVRMRDQFVLLPIPLAALEQVKNNPGAAVGLIAQYADRYLPGANLFDDRNAIGDTLSFFGRQELLHQLAEDLGRNQGIGLFGLRKSGKTSLLLQLGFALRCNPTVHLDLQPYGAKVNFGAGLFNKLVKGLINRLQKDCFSRSLKSEFQFEDFSSTQSAVQCSTEFIHRVEILAEALFKRGYERPLVFFLDEIERILPIETDDKERAEEFNAFFGALRSLSQEKRLLSFLIADVHPDASRINQWQQVDVATNPVFQFFKEIFVQPFS